MTTDSGRSGKFNRQDFRIVFIRLDGDFGIKQGILRHLHSFYCGGRTSRF